MSRQRHHQTFFTIVEEGLVMTTGSKLSTGSIDFCESISCLKTPATLKAHPGPQRIYASKHYHYSTVVIEPANLYGQNPQLNNGRMHGLTVVACMAFCVRQAFSSSRADRLYMSPSTCGSGGCIRIGAEHPPSTPIYEPPCGDLACQ